MGVHQMPDLDTALDTHAWWRLSVLVRCNSRKREPSHLEDGGFDRQREDMAGGQQRSVLMGQTLQYRGLLLTLVALGSVSRQQVQHVHPIWHSPNDYRLGPCDQPRWLGRYRQRRRPCIGRSHEGDVQLRLDGLPPASNVDELRICIGAVHSFAHIVDVDPGIVHSF